MKEPIVRLFRLLDDVEVAREALIRSGFPPESMQASAQGDEAGALKGNFLTGDHQADRKEDDPGPYLGHFDDVDFGGVYLLSVDVDSTTRAEVAAQIMAECGGVEPDVGGNARTSPDGGT